MSSNIIIFVKSNANNVAVKKDSIIGFDQIGNEYIDNHIKELKGENNG